MSGHVRKVKVVRQDVNLRSLLSDEKKKIRLYLLISGILFLVWGLTLQPRNTLNKPSGTVNTNTSMIQEVISFSQEPVTIDNNLLKSTNNKISAPPVKISIPSIGVDIPVKEAKVVKGYWEVFPDSAGWGVGSASPAENGNTVIFAHAREGLFLPLKKIKVGAEITVFTKDKWFLYKVVGLQEVLPSQTEVITPTNDSRLTLYTCTGFSDSKRLIVIAKKSQ